MIYSIHQPCYFPWLGLLSKIVHSDALIVLDEVQLSDSAFQHRNQFLTREGKIKYLTIPVVKKNYLQLPLKELKIADPTWGTTHRHFLLNNYNKHPFFDQVYPVITALFSMQSLNLIDVILKSMEMSMALFGIKTQVMMQHQLDYPRDAKKGELVLHLLKAAHAKSYLSGTGAKEYQDEGAFAAAGIKLNYTQFSHPVYPQKNRSAFTAGLSCLDLLFNLGAEKAYEMLNSTEAIQ